MSFSPKWRKSWEYIGHILSNGQCCGDSHESGSACQILVPVPTYAHGPTGRQTDLREYRCNKVAPPKVNQSTQSVIGLI